MPALVAAAACSLPSAGLGWATLVRTAGVGRVALRPLAAVALHGQCQMVEVAVKQSQIEAARKRHQGQAAAVVTHGMEAWRQTVGRGA